MPNILHTLNRCDLMSLLAVPIASNLLYGAITCNCF